MENINQNPIELLAIWHRRVRLNQRAHYELEGRAEKKARLSGMASAVLSAAVTILVLLAAKTTPSAWLSIVTVGLSIAVTAITTITTSAKWSERASQHHAVAVEYGKIVRKIEELLACPDSLNPDARDTLKMLREKMDRIPGEAPPVPRKLWSALPKELTPDLEHYK
jgi:hypothetical protein